MPSGGSSDANVGGDQPRRRAASENEIRFCQQHRHALEFLAELTDDDFRQMATELDRYNAEDLDRLDVIEHLSTSCAAIMDTQHASELVDSLMAMTILARLARTSSGEMASAISHAIQTSAARDSTLAQLDNRTGELRLRLTQLLSSGVIEKLAKAQDIFAEHDQTFMDGRIITDIRPVYGEDVDEPPTGIVVVHNLRIRYFREGQERSFTVALRMRDLEDLSRAIERAQRKARSFERLISGGGIDITEINPGSTTSFFGDRR